MANIARKNHLKDQSGQAMVEFALVFPVLFLLILLIIQTAFVCVAKQMVNYAAFCAARSAMVWCGEEDAKSETVLDKAKRAAYIACIPISPKLSVSGFSLPSPLDDVANYGSRYVWSSIATEVKFIGDDGKELSGEDAKVGVGEDVTVEVVHNYSMQIPIINKIIYYTCSDSPFAKLQRLIFGAPKKDLSLQPYSQYINMPQILGYSLYTLPLKARCTLTVEGIEGKEEEEE
jgi:hypothetical protein